MATRPDEGAERATPRRRRGTLRTRRIAIGIAGFVAVVGLSLAVVLARSNPSPPGPTGPSPSPASSAAGATPTAESTPDFRFLPALIQPTAEPTPVPPQPPKASLAFGLAQRPETSTNTAAVWVSWTAADGTPLKSGVSIKAGVDRGALGSVSIAPGTTRILRSAQTGHDYVYKVDVAGSSVAGSSEATAFRLQSIDDPDRTIAYSGVWSLAGFPGYLGGSARYSTSPGSVATLVFTGRSVAWIGPVGPGRGKATVQVDGVPAGTVSQVAAHYRPRQVLFVRSWPESGRHVLRIAVAGRRGATVMIDSFMVVGPPAQEPTQAAPTPSPIPTLPSATLPLRAAFYYGWYPEGWRQHGSESWTNFHPSAGTYDTSDPKVIASQVQAMRYGGIGAGIASWWGPGTRTDGRIGQLLAAARGSGLAWAVDDEVEEVADLDTTAIGDTLRYIDIHHAKDPSYLRIAGRFVVFVGAAPGDGCDMVQRWTSANAMHAYLVMAAVPGYAGCASQPDQWYASDPTVADQQVGQSSYAISPGFWRPGAAASLVRDPGRWSSSIRAMIASGAQLQLIGSFNQWGDGSSVESAREWASPSGFGTYLDALHNQGATGPSPGSGPPDGQTDPVLVGAGAIASCGNTNDEATAQILSTIDGTVFTVGDNAFESGTLDEYRNCYGPSWGAFLDRTRPAAGNRDYITTGAAGFFTYFGAAAGPAGKGYYAYDLGAWRIYVLNSNCSKVGGCGIGSPQETWLLEDLKAHPHACVGAYWQTARFSSGRFGDDARMQPFWTDLYRHGAEFVINGHDHNYQRYAPLTPAGAIDRAAGIREFIVGTGGNGHTALRTGSVPNREAGSDHVYGVLRLTLHPTGYEWQFLSTAKAPFADSGADRCH